MQRTIKLQLNTTLAQATTLKVVLEEFTLAFNTVCELGWNTQEKNGVRLHHETYYNLKEMCKGLVSDLIIQARTKATEAVKSALTHLRKYPAKLQKFEQKRAAVTAKGHQFNRRPPQPPSCPRSKLCPARYNLHTYKLNWPKQSVNLATSPRHRLVIGFSVPAYAQKYLGYPTDTADLIYRKGKFWLHVVVTIPTPELVDSGEVVGVDLGLNRPAVTSKRQFLGGRHWKEVDRRLFRLRRALQSKGTKYAKRHLKRLAGRQMRFHRDCDHVLSKRLVQSCSSGATIVIENLTEIRNTSKLGTKGKGKQTRRRLHSWSFAQFRAFLGYKAEGAGMKVVAIDPRHTSQTCSKCSYQHRSNRRSQSLFLCRNKECAYSLNADLNASYNIRDKHLASFGITLAGGPPSIGLSPQASA